MKYSLQGVFLVLDTTNLLADEIRQTFSKCILDNALKTSVTISNLWTQMAGVNGNLFDASPWSQGKQTAFRFDMFDLRKRSRGCRASTVEVELELSPRERSCRCLGAKVPRGRLSAVKESAKGSSFTLYQLTFVTGHTHMLVRRLPHLIISMRYSIVVNIVGRSGHVIRNLCCQGHDKTCVSI